VPAAARFGDEIDHGGVIFEGSPNVFINGPMSARVGDGVFCEIHGTQVIATGSLTVLVNGQPKARVGDLCSCAASIITGSPNVFVGG
jgi:uncharacterized Zn-binding protein involved in type VI secretion